MPNFAQSVNIFSIIFVRLVLRVEFHDPLGSNAPYGIAFYRSASCQG
jgi:hypothetical protein